MTERESESNTPDGDGADDSQPTPERRGNDGIVLSGGPVTNTGAIVAGEENRVTVRRTGAVRRGTRGRGLRANPLVNTGGLVSGAGHEVGIEDTGDVGAVEDFDHEGDPGGPGRAAPAGRDAGADPADTETRSP